jgi:hypothetical protein
MLNTSDSLHGQAAPSQSQNDSEVQHLPAGGVNPASIWGGEMLYSPQVNLSEIEHDRQEESDLNSITR